MGATRGMTTAEEQRMSARAEVLGLLRRLDDAVPPAQEEALAWVRRGEERGWPDVQRLAMYLAVCMDPAARGTNRRWLAALLASAEQDEDAPMIALALGTRAELLLADRGYSHTVLDRELARAIVLLENVRVRSVEVRLAHQRCAFAYYARDLWEMAMTQLDRSAATFATQDARSPMTDQERHSLATLHYNESLMALAWVAAAREQGPGDHITESIRRARRALRGARGVWLAPAWREDLDVFEELVDAIDPDGAGAPASRRVPQGEYRGFTHLSLALRSADPSPARWHARRAVETIDPDEFSCVHRLALTVLTEQEGSGPRHLDKGLEWGRMMAALEWVSRADAMSAMQSLIISERSALERAHLEAAAFQDELTGLANRRALHRHLAVHGADGGLAVAVFDVDRFKAINDVRGHLAGDEALRAIAGVLRAHARRGELAVRVGGDEFILVMRAGSLSDARARCETIVESVSGLPQSDPDVPLRISSGVALLTAAGFDDAYAVADNELYAAKQAGRDALATAAPAQSVG